MSSRFIFRWLVAACAVFSGLPKLLGAEAPFYTAATFSADGKEVCLLEAADEGEAREVRIGPSPAAARKVSLPIGVAAKVIGVAASAENGWLLLTGDDVWRRPAGKVEFEHWLHCETTPKWAGMAVDPRTGNVLLYVVGDDGTIMQIHVRAENSLRNVRIRRVKSPTSFAFAPDGKVFFAHEGDLWGGEIEMEEFEDEGETKRVASLTASRIAPLADLETFDGTPASTGVIEMAATRTHVFVHLARMGGSGWGWIARVPRSGKLSIRAREADNFSLYLREISGTLAATRILGPNARVSCLAAACDGRVMYRLDKPDGFFLHRRPDGPAELWKK